jgi:NAD(P)-dependent dehydrogenase (short-subunit alcohol dehydrogenase family)
VRLVTPHMRRQDGGSIMVTASNSGVFYGGQSIA